MGLNNIILIATDKLFLCFKDDINEFLIYKIYITKLFNILAFIFAAAIIIFIIGIVFISISKYIESLKKSTFRLSYSFLCMKNNINNKWKWYIFFNLAWYDICNYIIFSYFV